MRKQLILTLFLILSTQLMIQVFTLPHVYATDYRKGMSFTFVWVKLRDGSSGRSIEKLKAEYFDEWAAAKQFWKDKGCPAYDLWKDGHHEVKWFDTVWSFVDYWDHNVQGDARGKIFMVDGEFHITTWYGSQGIWYGQVHGCVFDGTACGIVFLRTWIGNEVLHAYEGNVRNVMKKIMAWHIGLRSCWKANLMPWYRCLLEDNRPPVIEDLCWSCQSHFDNVLRFNYGWLHDGDFVAPPW